MWNEKNVDDKQLDREIAEFSDSVMSGSSLDMNCESHTVFDFDCQDCLAGKDLVE